LKEEDWKRFVAKCESPGTKTNELKNHEIVDIMIIMSQGIHSNQARLVYGLLQSMMASTKSSQIGRFTFLPCV
jgi:hypothetical protein